MSDYIYPRINQSHFRRTVLLSTITLILLLAGCRPTPPSSTPAPPTPTASLLPTNTPSPDKSGGQITLPAPLVELGDTLGATWTVEVLSDEELAAMVGEAEVELGAVVARYTSATDDPGAPAFTVLVSPRAELNLDAYLDEVGAALNATGGVEAGGVTVNEAQIDYDLRSDGIPVALIRFQADGKLFDAAGMTIEGAQIALLDQDATNIIVATLTSDIARAAEIEPLLAQIIEALTNPLD